ncbi:MAG: SNF2 family helicase [Oscillospiraceae bacterium]|nr:SNF2 family helicase [Oscillospiraceae bacterium]
MPDRNKIRSFAWSSDAYFAGLDDYNSDRAEITGVYSLQNNAVQVYAQVADGNSKRSCSFVMNRDTETVMSAVCSCPARCDKFGYCRHVCAAMLEYSEGSGKYKTAAHSSPGVSRLISSYNVLAEAECSDEDQVGDIRIEPRLSTAYRLYLSLKIGRDKTYVVKSIPELIRNFDSGAYHSYGKELSFRHTPAALDEQSRALLDFITMLSAAKHRNNYYNYISAKEYELEGVWAEKFFTVYTKGEIAVNGEMCRIYRRSPDITLRFEKENGSYILTCLNSYTMLGSRSRLFFHDEYRHILYICPEDFSAAVCSVYEELAKEGRLLIAPTDIASFYSSVMVPLKKYVFIEGDELLEDVIPPEAEIRLYLDLPDRDTVYAKLEYTYGDKTYPAFAGNNPVSDRRAEYAAERAVLRYFEINETDPVHPLKTSGEDNIYRLCSEGIAYLTKRMELYASERFKAMTVRPPVHPSVGITPQSEGLLSLNIDADGYSISELIAILGSYRKGQKYHRLKDGSFVDLSDEGIEEFAGLADSLALPDKAFLKSNISIPKYRMLYLDSLQDNINGMRIRRSEDFKKAVRDFAESASSDYPVPKGLHGSMRPYQEYGFRWLKTISDYGFGGILADDMGLGKTIQSIALMLSAKESSDGHILSLVVCPSSLTLNWKSELERFAPSLNVSVVSGSAPVRSEIIRGYEDSDVLVTSYTMLTRDIAEYEDITFDFMFADEAQFIKNHTTQAAKAVKGITSRVRFALTGTPVENSLAELWSIFDYIMPEYLFGYTHFKKAFETPIVKYTDGKAAQELSRLTSPFLLRRMKKDVLTELPEKTETVLAEEMTEEQQKLYAANVLSMKKKLREKFAAANPNEGKIEILAMLTRLRQICCDPSLVYENYTSGSAKLESCMELIASCTEAGHKVLLFSQFTTMLDRIERRLKAEHISCYKLTGSTKAEERLRLVNSFNSDSTEVFLISLKAGGTGLNLTGADIVIHYDPWWNVSAENQATDRAYRIGQKNSVQVYKLIAKNTIEEKIRLLQENKRELADMAVNGDGSIMQMSLSDIMSLIE